MSEGCCALRHWMSYSLIGLVDSLIAACVCANIYC